MKTMTLNRLWHDYWKIRRLHWKPATTCEYKRLWSRLIEPTFGRRPVAAIDRRSVERWHSNMAATTPYQANRALSLLRSLLEAAVGWDEIEFNPAARIRQAKERPRVRYLDTDQIQRLLNAIGYQKPVEGAFLLVALYTGARPSELLRARWEWLEGDTIHLPDSKTGARQIYLPKPALTALAPVARVGVQKGLIFRGEVNHQALWKRVRRAAKLSGVRLYDLRHTFASRALAAGCNLEVISQLLGHSDPRTTRRYAHLLPETGLDAANKAAQAIERAGTG